MRKIAIKDLKPWADNPRDLTKTDFNRLISQLRLGEIENMIIMKGIEDIPDKTILNGNRRKTAYDKVGKKEATVVEVEFKPTDDGRFYLFTDGEQALRYDKGHVGEPTIFDSVRQGMLTIALAGNTHVGVWGQDLLEQLSTFKIPEEMFRVHMSSGTRVEDLIAAVSPDPNFGVEDLQEGKSGAHDQGIKQLVIYFTNAQYLEILPRLDDLMREGDYKDYTEVFIAALDALESI